MRKILSYSLCAILAASLAAAAPVKIIFDTDIHGDYDDVGALAILHAMADAGEAEILATVTCTRDCRSVAVVETINRYYGRADIPVGCVKGMGVSGGDNGYGLMEKYKGWYTHLNSSDAPDALEVYRKILAGQPDKSVVICSVGFITNMRKLLESKPDRYSPLDGKALIEKKVVRWVAMACSYPKGGEYNSQTDAGSSKIAFDNWPTPIIFSEFEYGLNVYAGRAIAESDYEKNPVKDAFKLKLPPRDKITPHTMDQLAGHPCWDETAVLAAVRGTDKYFKLERGRFRMIGNNGQDAWTAAPDGPHFRILESTPKTEIGRIIDELMMRPPKCAAQK